MLLWVALACVTAAALAAILRPLGAAMPAASNAAADIAIYRDQLTEIAAEHERGLIGSAEASAARTEIARRLLASSDRLGPAGEASATSTAPLGAPSSSVGIGSIRIVGLAYAVAAFLPISALALYLEIGSPGLQDHPFGATQDLEASPMTTLIAAVEAKLRENAGDGKGWDLIAPLYLKAGRYAEAASAFSQAARLLGQSVTRLAGYAEATTMAANGIVVEDARRAYAKLAELAPTRHEPQFWLALAQEQDGDVAGAAAAYKALLAAAPANAPWRSLVQERLDSALARLPPGATLPAIPSLPKLVAPATPTPPASTSGERGPTAADVAAAGKLNETERAVMIEQMVSGLATRLKTEGRDLRGWQRLIRAHVALGRTAEAKSALDEARANLADDPAAQSELGQLARALGLGP